MGAKRPTTRSSCWLYASAPTLVPEAKRFSCSLSAHPLDVRRRLCDGASLSCRRVRHAVLSRHPRTPAHGMVGCGAHGSLRGELRGSIKMKRIGSDSLPVVP